MKKLRFILLLVCTPFCCHLCAGFDAGSAVSGKEINMSFVDGRPQFGIKFPTK